MLNWRRDPDYEQRMLHYEQRKMQHEQRMKQHEQRMNQLESEIEQIEKETEQLRRENAREKALSVLIRQRCFPPESSLIPQPSIESDCGPSLR